MRRRPRVDRGERISQPEILPAEIVRRTGQRGPSGLEDLVDQPLPGQFEDLRIGGDPAVGHYLEMMAQPILEFGRARAFGAFAPLGPEQLG